MKNTHLEFVSWTSEGLQVSEGDFLLPATFPRTIVGIYRIYNFPKWVYNKFFYASSGTKPGSTLRSSA